MDCSRSTACRPCVAAFVLPYPTWPIPGLLPSGIWQSSVHNVLMWDVSLSSEARQYSAFSTTLPCFGGNSCSAFFAPCSSVLHCTLWAFPASASLFCSGGDRTVPAPDVLAVTLTHGSSTTSNVCRMSNLCCLSLASWGIVQVSILFSVSPGVRVLLKRCATTGSELLS